MRLLLWCLGVAAVLSIGCGQTRPCKEGTVFLAITLQGVAQNAQKLQVQLVGAAGKTVAGTVPHTPGQAGGTIEVGFDNGYPSEQTVTITVTALDAMNAVLSTSVSTQKLTAGCSRFDIVLGGNTNGDGSVVATDAPVTNMTDANEPSRDAGGDRMALSDGIVLPTGDAGNCPGSCIPGDEVPCGKCGKRTCTTDCTWGTCQGEGICAAGESRGCGNCGTEFCTNQCKWSGCNGSKTCTSGTTESCGNCGLRTCGTECEWGTCQNDGACVVGQAQKCGKCGVRKCGASATGCGWGACENEGTCVPGTREACGKCGSRVCLDTCAWGACGSEGVCSAGDNRSCGNCGNETCLTTCAWSGSCTGQGKCSPGDSASCGTCGDGETYCGSTCTWSACKGAATNCCPIRTLAFVGGQSQAIIACPVPF